MGLILCVFALAAGFFCSRRSLGQGVVALLVVGYSYGILRANYLDGLTHFTFDSALLGVYLGHFTGTVPVATQARSRDAVFWVKALALPAILMFLVPLQHPFVQLVGLRAAVLFLPVVILGARLKRTDVITICRALAILSLAALGVAVAEYSLGVERFFPRNDVTRIMFGSGDVGRGKHLRIPSTFSSAHAYAGAMLAGMPLLAEYWSTGRRWDRLLAALALVASTLGIFLSAARLPVVMLGGLFAAVLLGRGLAGRHKIALVAGACAIGAFVLANERLQRFRTLEDTSYVESRIHGSTNQRLLEILQEYPLGAGLGRASGTSMPFFLLHLAKPQIGLENEFSRIVIEEGLVGLALWLLFVLWTTTRKHPWGTLSPFGLRITAASVALSWGSGLIGTGLLTAIPATVLMVLQMGLLSAVAEGEARPVASHRYTLEPRAGQR